MKKLLLICLLLVISPAAFPAAVNSTLHWIYAPGAEDVGKLAGLQFEFNCTGGTAPSIVIPPVPGTVTSVTFTTTMNTNDTLTCAMRAKRVADGLVSAWSPNATKKFIGPPAIPTGLTLDILQVP